MTSVYTGTKHGAVQNGYFVGPPQGLPGQQAFLNMNHEIISYPVQDDFIFCGRGVCQGTELTVQPYVYGNNNSPFGVINPTSSSTEDDFVGILLRDHAAANNEDAEAGKRLHDMAGILEDGYCFVKLYQNAVVRGRVFMVRNGANPLNAPVGSFISDNASGNAIEIPRLKWWATYNISAQPFGVIRVYSR